MHATRAFTCKIPPFLGFLISDTPTAIPFERLNDIVDTAVETERLQLRVVRHQNLKREEVHHIR